MLNLWYENVFVVDLLENSTGESIKIRYSGVTDET